MGIRVDVGGKLVNGSVYLNYKTKRADMEHSIATVSQKVVLNDVPIESVEKEIGKSLAILIQKPIREMKDQSAAVKLARQNPINWNEIVGVKRVTVRKMSIPEMMEYFKDHPEERKKWMAEMEELEG